MMSHSCTCEEENFFSLCACRPPKVALVRCAKRAVSEKPVWMHFARREREELQRELNLEWRQCQCSAVQNKSNLCGERKQFFTFLALGAISFSRVFFGAHALN